MKSTFFGLNIAASGLNAYQASINTTANNISNVNTEGYSRQEVNLVATSALRVYQRYGSVSTGVQAEAAKQVRDEYYDVKYWENQSKLGYYDKKLYYMDQIQTYFKDDSTVAGFSTLYAKMFNALDKLQDNAGDTSVRSEFISTSQELMTYFNNVSTELYDLQSTVNDEIKSTVNEMNSIAKKISVLNKQINIIEMEGGHANELRDERALLVDRLSEIVPIDVREVEVVNTNNEDMYTGATYYTIKINGVLFVDNYEYNQLACTARDEKHNQADVDGLYDVTWVNSGAKMNVTASNMEGSLKALFEIRDGNDLENLTGYVSEINADLVKVENPSITDIEKMNMPNEGIIKMNNVEFAYDSFTFETDAEGKITSYTFHLKNKSISVNDEAKFLGRTSTIGTSVDYKGIPYYQNQMNEFLRGFVETFNEIESQGKTLDGDEMGSFFVAYDKSTYSELGFLESLTDRNNDAGNTELTSTSDTLYQLTASNIRVNRESQKDSKKFATTSNDVYGDGVNYDNGIDAADLIKSLKKLQSDIELFRGSTGDQFLQCIYADITVDTQECDVFSKTYTSIGESIDNQRMSVSAVDEDSEAIDLIKFQNAYNLSSKCISVLNEMYDRLITQTGV